MMWLAAVRQWGGGVYLATEESQVLVVGGAAAGLMEMNEKPAVTHE